MRVVRALARGGRTHIERNVILVDRHGNRSEIDVMFGPWWRRTFVECKAYEGSGTAVALEEVAKFKEVLSLHGMSPRRGLFITNSRFSPRALTTGVPTLDAAGLLDWERRLRLEGALQLGAAWGARLVGGALVLGGWALALAPWAPPQPAEWHGQVAADAAEALRLALVRTRAEVCAGWELGVAGPPSDDAAARRGRLPMRAGYAAGAICRTAIAFARERGVGV